MSIEFLQNDDRVLLRSRGECGMKIIIEGVRWSSTLIIVTNTWFQHKPIHQATWYYNGDRFQSGHMLLVNCHFRTCVLYTQVLRSIYLESDHELVISAIRSKIKAECHQMRAPHWKSSWYILGSFHGWLWRPPKWCSLLQLCIRHMRPCLSCQGNVKLIGWLKNYTVCPRRNVMLASASIAMMLCRCSIHASIWQRKLLRRLRMFGGGHEQWQLRSTPGLQSNQALCSKSSGCWLQSPRP